MKRFFTIILLVSFALPIFGQDTIGDPAFGMRKKTENMKTTYHRSSWYNILIHHNDQEYAEEILETYMSRPTNDKFNEHSLPVEVVTTKGKKYAKFNKIDDYIMNNNIANDLVAKWFNRDNSTGYCDMELIYRRGMEDASTEDIEMSELVKRGRAILTDSGTDLIGNTFVLAHDIIYIDKGERNKNVAEGFNKFGEFLKSTGEALSKHTGDDSYSAMGESFGNLSATTGNIVNEFEGFRVKIQTHLYRLNWKDSDNDFFYDNYYLDENYYDEEKFRSWDTANYTLSYIGTQEAICAQTVLVKQDWNLSQLIKIVLYRTLDESVVKLQKNYEEFKIKEPIFDIIDGQVIAKIGLKEGVSPESEYEVLEIVEDEDGNTSFKRVGEIRPIPEMIWDNRYMALEDGAPNADLGGTYFEITSGEKRIFPGLLIREIEF